MRFLITILIELLLFCLATVGQSSSLQSTALSDSQAIVLAKEAVVALSGTSVMNDLTVTGTAAWIMGSTHETGSIVLKSRGEKESRVELNFGASSRIEIRNDSQVPAGRWIGADSVSHSLAFHNCFTPPAWFSPVSTLTSVLGTNGVISYLGQEILQGAALDHLRAYHSPSISDPEGLSRRLTILDIYLDSSSHLPSAINFNIHPDSDAETDIPVEVRFGDYRNINGINIPFKIQRLWQGVLNLDVSVNTAAVNSGLLEGDFSLQ